MILHYTHIAAHPQSNFKVFTQPFARVLQQKTTHNRATYDGDVLDENPVDEENDVSGGVVGLGGLDSVMTLLLPRDPSPLPAWPSASLCGR